MNFTLQRIIANRYKPEVSMFSELRWQISAAPGLPSSQNWPLPSPAASVRITIKFYHVFITWPTTCWRQGSPWPQRIQGGPLRSSVLVGCKTAKTSTGSLECGCFVHFLLFLLFVFLPLLPPLQLLEFSGKGLYTLQSKCLKCFSVSNWK